MEKITDKLAALPPGGKYFSLEFFPPKTQMGFANLQARLERMATALRPLFVNVTWGAGGSTASKSLELAELCQRQLGLTTCLHLTCTNMSRSLVDEALAQAKALGIRNILALRGDPPRHEEYKEDWGMTNGAGEADGEGWEFTWAVDLVRYIRKEYGDYFCVGVAAYPEGHHDRAHPDSQSPEFDLPYLVEKTRAGVDFIMTQLFYDVDAFLRFEAMLRGHESGLFEKIPIIPGLMPIQSYQIIRRTTKLSHAKIPPKIMERLDHVKGDDEAVKSVGIDILSEMVETITSTASPDGHRGVHLYTLNLEKVVAHILERCHLIPVSPTTSPNDTSSCAVVDDSNDFLSPEVAEQTARRRRLSSINSAPRNRVVVDRASAGSRSNASFEALEDEAGVPMDAANSRANQLAISEGEGSLGREATWDDYPNGRWGDARSPAFGEIDGYGPSLHVSVPQAVKLWGYPVVKEDISQIFRRHIRGEIDALPWSEEGLNPETNTIIKQLEKMIDKGWWTVASQPAVNGLKSTDEVFGWGPKNGFVFQKPFVELFLPAADWARLEPILQSNSDVTYFAGNSSGVFVSSDESSVNPVTWGTFAGKEIITPTIIESVSFRAWLEEAFSIWAEWRRIYPPRGETAKLLEKIRADVWLVNIIHHRFVESEALWELLQSST